MPLISLYLYRAEHSPSLVNRDRPMGPGAQSGAPPLVMDLHYLVTLYGSNETENQLTLGEVLRAIHEVPFIGAGDALLSPELAATTEVLRIMPSVLPFAEVLALWRAFGRVPYRLCLAYEVTAAQLFPTLGGRSP